MANKWTVSSILDWTVDYFERVNIPQPQLEAEVLLASVLNCKRLELALRKDELVPAKKRGIYREYVKERQTRKPVSYILGQSEFMGLRFDVNEHTLIPRPETELLVEEVIRLAEEGNNSLIVDVGTGSGNIAVSVAKLSSAKSVYALDISADALSVCCRNIRYHCQAAKVMPKQGNLLEALKGEELEHSVDIIVSNPPYIAFDEFKQLEPEISYEPRLALEGGKDGLDFYSRLVVESKTYLKPGGYLVFEMHSGKSDAISDILTGNGFSVEKIIKDYSGFNRVIVGKCLE